MGEKRNACKLLVEKQDGKTPLGRPSRRWVDDIKMDVGEIGWGGVNWNGLAQDRDKLRALVNSVMNFLVPLNAGKLWSGLTTGDLSSSAQLHIVMTIEGLVSLRNTSETRKTNGNHLHHSCFPALVRQRREGVAVVVVKTTKWRGWLRESVSVSGRRMPVVREL
jgi:hypothetical protein